MNYVITGSRSWPLYAKNQLVLTLSLLIDLPNSKVGVGDCPDGVDRFTREWLYKDDPEKLYWKKFDADWATHGKYAGPHRNKEMIEKIRPDLVLAFFVPGEVCKGTWSCVEIADEFDIRVKPFRLK